MTCIVGLVEKDRVYIGGDSAATDGWSLCVRADEKIFINGQFVMGFTSSFRMGQLLRYKFKPPEPRCDDVYEYMVTDFIDAIRECFTTGGWAKKDEEREQGGTFLVGYRGRLFGIDSDYQVAEFVGGYWAVGSGAEVALGVLFATSGLTPKERIELALLAAEQHNAGVRGPFKILSI